MGRLWAVAIPHTAVSKRANLEALADWCNEIVGGTNFAVLASATLSKSVLLRLRKRLLPLLKKDIEHLDVCWGSFDLGTIRTTNTSEKDTLQLEQGAFRKWSKQAERRK